MLWLVLQLRIWRAKQLTLLLVNLVFCLSWCGYLIVWQQKITQQTLSEQVTVNRELLFIEPDEYTINGDLLKFTGQRVSNKQKILGYYRIRSEQEKAALQGIQHPLTVQVAGKVGPINAPTNQNEFNFQRYMLGKNISNEIQVTQLRSAASPPKLGLLRQFLAIFHVIRKKMIDHFERMPQPLGWFIQVLLIGYQSEQFQEQMDQINRLGLLYLFTLSGMHVFYLVAMIRFLLRQVGTTKETTDLLLLGILPIYGIIGGSSLGLVRSILMTWLHLASQRFGQWHLTGIETWSLVLLMNLFYSPVAVFSLGAQLSYLLTLILILSRQKKQWLTGLQMGAFTIPLVLRQTFVWNIWTIPLSILIGPIFDWLIFPVVIVGMIFVPFQLVCNGVLKILAAFFSWSSDLPGTIIFGKPPAIFILFWLGLLLACQVKPKKLLLLSCLLLSGVCAYGWIHLPLNDEVTYFDIGQGDCSLIKTRFDRQVYLIDTGGKLSFNTEKWQVRNSRTNGETVVVNYLHSQGISRIDRLYLTHQDTDHVGNFPSISQSINVKQIIVPVGMEQLASFQRRLQLSRVKPSAVVAVTNQVHETVPSLALQILHPFERGQGKNEDSLVLLYRSGKTNFLFTGDLDRANELKVLEKYPNLRADIMKTGHHGSKTASDPKFIQQVQPKLAIISAGRNNRYGHPNEETLVTLRKYRVPFLLTARDGMIKVILSKQGPPKLTTYGQMNIY